MALNNPELPSQAGQAGKVLTTNGSIVSWGAASGEWSLIETLSPSASSSVTTAASFSGYTWLKVRFRLEASSASETELGMRMNGDSGLTYTTTNGAGTSTGITGQLLIGALRNTYASMGEVIMARTTPAIASGILGVHIMTGFIGTYFPVFGQWQGGNNTSITSLTFRTGAGTMTGTIEVWGR